MKAYAQQIMTQFGLVTFHYDETNVGISNVLLDGVNITHRIPAAVLKQTTSTIIKKLNRYL